MNLTNEGKPEGILDQWFARHREHIFRWMRIHIGAVLIVSPIFLGMLSIHLFPIIISYFWENLRVELQNVWIRISVFLLMFTAAYGLYRMRKANLSAYALLEITTGLFLIWYVLSYRYETGLGFSVALMGAIYLIVRGLDNLNRARNEDREDSKIRVVSESDKNLEEALSEGLTSASILRFLDRRRNKDQAFNSVEIYRQQIKFSGDDNVKSYQVILREANVDDKTD